MTINSLPADSDVIEDGSLVMIRVIDAPAELVFQAWTDPDHLARWWGPKGLHTPRNTVEVEPQVGGSWKATMVRDDDGAEFPSHSVFVVVEPPRHFELEAHPDSGFPSTLSVTLEELQGKTVMTVVNRVLTEAAPTFDGMIEGWGTAFVKLRRLVGATV
ncbi:SRPBCC family protein [Compostimonas suwonensis]|uniref:Uncharacterized protein YndB with AHSA1/START domain n=1 Tax=Compostimonas suwonensis TaxID=1048394 RepID=A0A2M9C4X9_9MICO|nr:SRPBCC domain-containing protein [Compostimonas suwonensis]PJJ65584.1 uncharacterized protein YndB with AHSA1/START domain [Compostimonas suwonensis]